MKKLDKLIIKSVVGPFILTFVIVVFILLTQYMLKYFDDFVGKGLGMDVFAELIFYFSINMTPAALPLAVLLSSLMTFGNLGEHFELTAIKGAGISLTRALRPLFFFVLLISFVAFLSNNYVGPQANLKAYSLLYDIKQKKPALDIQEGVFYGGIPKFRIKVNKKHEDGETIEDVIIYDHSQEQGNKNVIIARSGRMYTFDNDRFLRLELFDGNRYVEGSLNGNRTSSNTEKYLRTNFDTTKMTFSLASFGLQRTKEEYFASHRRMQNMEQLGKAMDSMRYEQRSVRYDAFTGSNRFYSYHLRYDTLMPPALAESYHNRPVQYPADSSYQDSASERSLLKVVRPDTAIQSIRALARSQKIKTTDDWRQQSNATATNRQKKKYEVHEIDTALITRVDRSIDEAELKGVVAKALNQSRTIKNELQINSQKLRRLESEISKSDYESTKKVTQAISCLIMFLIGAPLGSIIKRGGLGVPVLISVAFFIAFYVLSEMSRKWADELVMDADLAVWFPNLMLLPFGIVFLIQARLDTRLLETDFYQVWIDRIKKRIKISQKRIPVEQKVG